MLRGDWAFSTVDIVKRDGEWYAHFVLKRNVELVDEPETIVAIGRGEVNLATAIAISKRNPEKPMKGQFWRSSEIKRIRDIYSHIRRKLQETSEKSYSGSNERRRVNRKLHIIANQITECVKQFPKPVIVMENLDGIRKNLKSKKLNKRFHSLPFRKLQS